MKTEKRDTRTEDSTPHARMIPVELMPIPVESILNDAVGRLDAYELMDEHKGCDYLRLKEIDKPRSYEYWVNCNTPEGQVRYRNLKDVTRGTINGVLEGKNITIEVKETHPVWN
jgi:hypothetical protein